MDLLPVVIHDSSPSISRATVNGYREDLNPFFCAFL